jgi:hypothetical protein
MYFSVWGVVLYLLMCVEIHHISIHKKLYFVRYFAKRGHISEIQQMIDDLNEKLNEEECQIVNSILNALAFTQTTESNDEHNNTMESSTSPSYSSSLFPNNRYQKTLGYHHLSYSERLQIFQALYNKTKSLGLKVDPCHYYQEAYLHANLDNIQQV